MNIDLNSSKVICIGRNYLEHIKELNNDVPENPVIFIKPNTSISSNIILPISQQIHYEVEIVFVFDDQSRFKGVSVGIDLTNRNLQTQLKNKGLPWELAKAFDNSAVIGEFISIEHSMIENLSFKAYKNNELIQHGSYDLMIHKPYQIVDFLKQNNISVLENDLLMTGTPKGVGVVDINDSFRIELFCGNEKILEQKFN